jgi:hypothetical protein
MTRAVLDGPLTLDSAISREAQTTKQFDGQRCRYASDFEAGNPLAKALNFQGAAC